MKNGKKGFVVSAVLYPLLVLFLAIIMGLLSMTDTRKRILDKMKLEITDNIFDDAACSCDTILAKLNYIIANGTGGSGGGDTGSYAYNKVTLNVKTYESLGDFPVVGNIVGDIAVISSTPVKNYYVSSVLPKSPQEGTVWIVQDRNSEYFITSDWNKIGVSYVMQYENGIWNIKKSYIYTGESWQMLYYVPVSNGEIDLASSDINAKIEYTYDYTGKYQVFHAPFSGTYEVELWGAQGGYYNASQAAYGGKGAHTKGTIYLDAGTALYLYIGGQGASGYYDDTKTGASDTGNISSGGWNGGGYGTYKNNSYFGKGGGGATDIRIVPTTKDTTWDEFDSLKSRIMVAAGGGGGADVNSSWYYGGAGGGLKGSDGHNADVNVTYVNAENGGTQSLGGVGVFRKDNKLHIASDGGFGYGGNAAYYHNGGGGGGYFGGGGGGHNYSAYVAGGGGSSYISGHDGCNSISEDSTKNNIIMTGSAYHYPIAVADGNNSTEAKNYYFTDSLMEDNSNTGNGHAKITLKSIEVRTTSKVSAIREDSEKIWSYTYTGTYQTFTAPVSGYYVVEMNGASSGAYDNSKTKFAGKGAYTKGKIYLNKGTTLYVYVGGQGGSGYFDEDGWTGYSTYYSKGGYNGGGNGTYKDTSYFSQGGGGATDIRILSGNASDFSSLKSRIMVAGGGGGGANVNSNWYYGGDGGGLKGSDGHNTDVSLSYVNAENGGTQTFGGIGTFRTDNDNSSGKNGSFGLGGDGAYNYSAGGGGGYFGGGGGGNNYSAWTGGGGGSSYISGYEGVSSIDESSTLINLKTTGASYHYSGLYFLDGQMKDGNNYGDGNATITLDEKVTKSDETIENEKLDHNTVWTYTYSGTYQSFLAPVSGYYEVNLYGASAGTFDNDAGRLAAVGEGAHTKGKIYLNKGTTLYVYVGGQGGSGYFDAKGGTGSSTYYSKGGWNGGGNGTYTNTTYWGQGGGGATDIRLEPGSYDSSSSLKSRIMVAAGGGGYSRYSYSCGNNNADTCYGVTKGGEGGTLKGSDGHNNNASLTYLDAENGATQTMGGTGVRHYNTANWTGASGRLGVAGNGAYNYSGGGGGGYYGGGGGGHNERNGIISGGGGSSYISGYSGCNSIDLTLSDSEIVHTGSAYHQSGYYFTESSMEGGVNYGDGKATIKLLEKTTVSLETLNNLKLEKENEWNYTYQGKYQIFTAPVTGTYQVDLYGASSGYFVYSWSNSAGKGAHTTGDIYLKEGTKLYVYVGGHGGNGYYDGQDLEGMSKYFSTGGWNGGGNGMYQNTTWFSSGGGGATDIRYVSGEWNDFSSLKSRIMVAGGGGGFSRYSYSCGTNNADTCYGQSKGGDAGTLVGSNGTINNNTTITYLNTAAGGSQTSGGKGTFRNDIASIYNGKDGTFGSGGNGNVSSPTKDSRGGGGGGGYYGGGGGGHNWQNGWSSAAGGSSYISGYEGCNSIDLSLSTDIDNIIHTGSAYHQSNYYFTESSMESGSNLGHGSAVIILKNKNQKSDSDISDYKLNKENTWSYTYAGQYQVFTVPADGIYTINLNGAQGGYRTYEQSAQGGYGASTSGDIYLSKGTKLYVYVGGHGGYSYHDTPATGEAGGNNISSGGYNGGGNGTYSSTSAWGNGGGGATDVRLVSGDSTNFNSLKSRIMVAAGGGGITYNGDNYNYGGGGGTLQGINGKYKTDSTYYLNGSTGGTQSAGGIGAFRADNKNLSGSNGGFGIGGKGAYTSGGGGGGGYFGGGGGGHNGKNYWLSAAGGSSYISGYDGCNSITESSTASSISLTGDKYHYSGYYFTNAVMTEAVNTGDGYASIILKTKTSESGTKNDQTEWSYDYSGQYQTFTALKTGYYYVQLWGASGGYMSFDQSAQAGLGSYTAGRIELTKGTKLYVYVGGSGGKYYYNATGWTGLSTYYSTGGWNGGGDGTYNSTSNWGNGGGGATDIRTVSTDSLSSWNESGSLKSRIMVAAGGSGVQYSSSYHYGTAGGGLVGYNGRNTNSLTIYTNASEGGTQISGGKGTYRANANNTATYSGNDGGFGYGGTGAYYQSSGGGGGWYGGGGGGYSDSKGYITGAGGSSYISGHNGCIGVNSSGTPLKSTASSKADSYSWTNFIFTNTEMIDGRGYSWTTTVSSSSTGMPNYSGSGTMTGNLGNGYARITYLGA